MRRCARISAVVLALACAAAPLRAQLLRGTVRVAGTDRTVAGARISAVDRLGKMLAEAVSDDSGHFVLALNTANPFQIVARKVGAAPATSDFMRATVSDTLVVDLSIPEDAPELPTVTVEGDRAKSPNQRAYDDAVRRGWTVLSPEKVAEQRGKFRDFSDMLRALQVPGIRVGRPGECVQSTRWINRCLTYVIDDVPVGPFAQIVPTDVYFFAILSASDAGVRWGQRAPWGAIAVYTRMYGDPKKQ